MTITLNRVILLNNRLGHYLIVADLPTEFYSFSNEPNDPLFKFGGDFVVFGEAEVNSIMQGHRIGHEFDGTLGLDPHLKKLAKKIKKRGEC